MQVLRIELRACMHSTDVHMHLRPRMHNMYAGMHEYMEGWRHGEAIHTQTRTFTYPHTCMHTYYKRTHSCPLLHAQTSIFRFKVSTRINRHKGSVLGGQLPIHASLVLDCSLL